MPDSLTSYLSAVRERLRPCLCRVATCELHTHARNDLTRLLALVEAGEALLEHIEHDRDCTSARCSQGEPTPDGGYRQMFAGTWYRTKPNPEPIPCECGMRDALTRYRAVVQEATRDD